MLAAYRKKFGFTIADVYFFNGENLELQSNTDIVFYLQRIDKPKESEDFYTLKIDLTKDDSQLFSEINRTTRYHINRAMKSDNIRCVVIKPSFEDIQKFADFYNLFADTKNIAKCNVERLEALRINDGLVLTKAIDQKNRVLSYHAYVIDKSRARLLYSASHFRQSEDNDFRSLIGRANKSLHWSDILYFKNEGYLTYDFGGIEISGEEGSELQNIAKFKKAFGGEVIHEYNLIEGKSLFGKMLIKIINLVKRLKK